MRSGGYTYTVNPLPVVSAVVPSNGTQDGGTHLVISGQHFKGALSVLEDDVNTSVEEELQAVFEDLGEDQLAEVVAFCWVGQGTYEASDWDEAMEEAQDLVRGGTDSAIEEMLDQPMLASVLEAGLAAFDLNCNGVGASS